MPTPTGERRAVEAEGAKGPDATVRRPRRWLRRLTVAAAALLGVVLVGASGASLWFWTALRGSLPQLDGEIPVRGLSHPVRIERDALGVPTLEGASRADLARATGFVHAQDRFFQMDLLRRRAAGELSELFGRVSLDADRAARLHRFRARAAALLAAADQREREIIEAYAAGVNAGLASLGRPPFEYLVFRSQPAPWGPEDSALVLFSMFLLLQDGDGGFERMLGTLHDALPHEVVAFLAPGGTEWDAPIEGSPQEVPAIPGPELLDLRSHWIPQDQAIARLGPAPRLAIGDAASSLAPEPDREVAPGSNSWALSAARTADGRAILANDIHLPLGVPGTWYRLRLVLQGSRTVTGVTLPGAPAIAVGSNGRVAWGFTNSFADASDLVLVDRDPSSDASYPTPEGPKEFTRHEETIKVRGGDSVPLEVVETIWGPLIGERSGTRATALRWTAHDPEGANFLLLRMEQARDLDEALALAPRCGIPAQNCLVADAGGRIGWTLMGRIPRRVGIDGTIPASWSDGTRGWRGWLGPEEVPKVVDPASGNLWTANARVIDGPGAQVIGNGGFMLGARARQIRDDLKKIAAGTEKDLLAVQLDDRAIFLERWRTLLLDALSEENVAADPHRRELRRLAESWGDRASVDSAGYRIVRAFRVDVGRKVFGAISATLRDRAPGLDLMAHPQYEGPLWRMVTERPPHLLDPQYRSWDELLLAAADAVRSELSQQGANLAERTWGERNRAAFRHPLTLAAPFLGRWLDMPYDPLPGDSHMPRVQSPTFGASLRMVVSPGHEEDALFEMPCGQSGHPLSDHYRDGHAAWVAGEAAPFLPGPPRYTLVLAPAR